MHNRFVNHRQGRFMITMKYRFVNHWKSRFMITMKNWLMNRVNWWV